MNNSLFVGVARQIITPPLGTLLFGYAQERPGNVVADDLNATALVLRQNDVIAALVSLDLCLIDEKAIAEMRRAVSAATEIPESHITIHATHTHSGPATVRAWGWGERNAAYLDLIRPKIVQAVSGAKANLQPARVGIGITKTDVGVNRRELTLEGNVALGFNEWGPRDDDLTAIRFEGENGTIAQIVHLCAHPTSRGHESSISRDWPGVMMDRVEKITGAKVLFLNGACGDVAPRTNYGGVVGDGAPAAEEVGLRAATDALRALRSIKEFRELPLRVVSDDIEIPNAPLPSRDEAELQVQKYAHAARDWGSQNAEWHYWSAVVEAHRQEPQPTRKFAQNITQLGPIAFVPFPGEIFSEIQLRVKDKSTFAHTLCLGNTNGSWGYLVTRQARARGGYEVWVARAYGAYLLAENSDDVLVMENIRILSQ